MATLFTSRRRALLFLLLSLVMLGVAVSLVRPTASLQFSGLHANGTVTALRLNSSGVRSVYDPLVRFKAQDGDIIEFEAAGAKAPDRRVGDVVDVLYAADRPTHAMIDRGAKGYLLPVLLGLIALPTAFFSVRVLLQRGSKLK